MVSTNVITLELVQELRSRNREYVIPNLYLGAWECDVYSETKKYSEEYEIKISKADYLNDFKKKDTRYQWVPAEKQRRYNIINKHDLIKDGKRVNRFWYVAPMGLLANANIIFPTMIPEYAGLIYYCAEERYNKFIIAKQAPLLSKKNLLHPEAVVDASYYRYIHYSNKYYKDAIKTNKE
jgi:hypothetical protein